MGDRDSSSAVGHATDASVIIDSTPSPEFLLPPMKNSLVMIIKNGKATCPHCGIESSVLQHQSEGNDAMVKKGHVGKQGGKLLAWWVQSQKHRELWMERDAIFEDYNSANPNDQIKFDSIKGRISELLGANLLFVDKNTTPPLYSLNIEFVREVLARGGRLRK